MVDLLGRPSCADCFDTCLNRDSDRRLSRSPPKDAAPTPKNNLGGLTISSKEGKSRESSPAIEELEQRLGISRSREPSPSITTSRGEPLPYGRGPSPSPVSRFPTQPDIIRETNSLDRIRSLGSTGSSDAVSGRFGGLDKLVSSPKQIGDGSPRVHNRLHDKLLDLTNVSSSITSPTIKDPPTPNLAYEVSKHSASPRVEILPRRKFDLEALSTKPTANTVPLKEPIKQPSAKETLRQYPANSPKHTFKLDQSALCAGCSGPLFSVRDGGKFITVPGENGEEPSVYHTACFKCVVCRDVFRETGGGQAAFVKTETGPSHLDCTSPQKAPVRRSRSTSTPNIPPPSPQTPAPVAVAPQLLQQHLRSHGLGVALAALGVRRLCPPWRWEWCRALKGRNGTRLVWEDRQAVPGCGKRLDSAAKSDGDGGVWCRECLLLLGIGGSPQASPQRSTTPLSSQTMPILTRKPTTHTTGNTTLARQLTGGDNTLLRQMTGGGSSPTKQLSSTGVVRPRPKSVIGMRTTRSIDLSGGRTYLMNSLDK
ncbi:hypothetical protein AX16_009534 [Volvariella volvacea WC 439]|nr:hypothetical protein AX16_009534 [Volvariella volvacea WC 439]